MSRWADSAEKLYAADGAAATLIDDGFEPVVVGDLDSLPPSYRTRAQRVEHRPDQGFTDCDKLLMLAQEDGHEAITLTGIEGDQPDHMLATFSSALASPLAIRLAFRRGIGYVLQSGEVARYNVRPGARVSLLPLAECLGISLTGVEWPLREAPLAPGRSVSISNRATEKQIEIELGEGTAFLFIGWEATEMPRW